MRKAEKGPASRTDVCKVTERAWPLTTRTFELATFICPSQDIFSPFHDLIISNSPLVLSLLFAYLRP